MAKYGVTLAKSALASFLVCGGMTAASAPSDLSRYRDFHFGTDLATVARQTGTDLSRAKTIHLRPALIQELDWRPQPLGPSDRTEPAADVIFGFYDGHLFRIVVSYDPYEIEGLTTDDIIGTISLAYGTPGKPPSLAKAERDTDGDREETVARWEDPLYRFDLIRTSYGPGFRLIGVLKTLESRAEAATLEAVRLDAQEAPQRDAARAASEQEAAKAKLAKARLVNKPNFRP